MEKETTAWSEMANNLANTWVETGTQMWKGWFALMDLAPTSDTVTELKPEFKYAAERFANNQELFVRFIQLSFNAWKEIFPKVEAGEDWQQVLNKYTEQMRTQLKEFSEGTLKANQDVAQLWQIYIKEMQKFSQLGTDSLGASILPLGKAITGTSAPWLELNNIYWNLLYEETFGSLIRSPILGPNRELTGKVLRAFDAWTNLYRGSIDYQVVLADIQIRSFEELMQELISSAEKGQKVDDWRQFQQIWSSVADRVFEENFCNEDNLKIRGKFLNALNSYSIQQQELMELWLKMMNMPVRSEVDEVHKNIYELRKEIKTLKKKLTKYEAISQETQELRQELQALKEALGTH